MDIEGLEVRVNNRNTITYWKNGVLVGRRCTKCYKDKNISEFDLKIKEQGVYHPECKECRKQYNKTNRRHIKEYQKQWRKTRKEKNI